jgi:hypothetical protein
VGRQAATAAVLCLALAACTPTAGLPGPAAVLRINGLAPSPVPYDFNSTLSVNLEGALCSAAGTGATATCPGTSSLAAVDPTAYCKVRGMPRRAGVSPASGSVPHCLTVSGTSGL